jgi:hypothetical protein
VSAITGADFTRPFSTAPPKRSKIDCSGTIYSAVSAARPSSAGGSSGANRKGGAVSALPAAAAPATTAAAAATATTAAAAAPATTAAAAAPADDHLHGAGLSHDRQFIAESATAAIKLKVNKHSWLYERRHGFRLTDGAGSVVQLSLL